MYSLLLHVSPKAMFRFYTDFKYVLDKVGKENEYFLLGTNDLNKIRTSEDKEVIKKPGLIDFQVLSPAEYLCDDIEDADADERNNRIHEQCGVIKFIYGKDAKSIIVNSKTWS